MLGKQIRKRGLIITCLAELRVREIVPVRDETVGMKVVGIIEGCEDRVVDACSGVAPVCDESHVVDDRVHHQVHASVVHFLTEIQQVLFCAEVVVQAVQVQGPVSVIGLTVRDASINVLDNGGYHDCVKAHSLNVVEILDSSLPGSPAVQTLTRITGRCC